MKIGILFLTLILAVSTSALSSELKTPYKTQELTKKQTQAINSIIGNTFKTSTQAKKNMGEDNGMKEGGVYYFLSYALKEVELKSILEALAREAKNQDVMGVFRGLPPGIKTIDNTILKLHNTLKGINPKPTVIVNSVIFKEAGIENAPAMAEKVSDTIFVAYGIYGRDHFERAKELYIKANPTLPKGIVKLDVVTSIPIVKVAEKPFSQEMKDRASKIDWNKKGEEAKDRYWTKMKMYTLPAAEKYRARLIDLSIVATKTYRNPQTGEVLVLKGMRFNPAKERKFMRSVIVFDPFSKRQKEIAVQKVKEAKEKGLLPILMVTRIVPENRGNYLVKLRKEFHRKVYILNDSIKTRFQIEKCPSVITQESELMKIEEFKVNATQTN